MDSRNWWDLSEKDKGIFKAYVREYNVQGWEDLKAACAGFGFEATDDMPTIYELRQVALCSEKA